MSSHDSPITRLRSHGLALATLTLAVPTLWALALPSLSAFAVVVALVLPFLTMSVLECEVPHVGDAQA